MSACSISVFNKGGGVIVAQKDNSILPVIINHCQKAAAFVVGARTQSFWEHVILSFLKICPDYRDIIELADNFIDYSRGISGLSGCEMPGPCEGDIFLWGFDEDSIFPSGFRIGVAPSDGLSIKVLEEQKVTFENPAIIETFGDWGVIAPVLSGVSSEIYGSCLKFYERQDMKADIGVFREKLGQLNSDYRHSIITGIDTFDIQDMIDTAESLLNANIRLRELETGEKTGTPTVKEIAVLTKTEGVTWIKHSIYAV